MWRFGVDVLFRIISTYMVAIRAPMMKGCRCVSCYDAYTMCKCVLC